MAFTIIVFVLVLSVLVFVHELGHYATARMFGVKAEEFGFGFPPRVFGWKKVNGKRKFFWGSGEHESEDTIWSLNWIPLGGFVKIKGEDGESKDPDSFAAKKTLEAKHYFIRGRNYEYNFGGDLSHVGFYIGQSASFKQC